MNTNTIIYNMNIAIISLFIFGALAHLLLMPVFPQEFTVTTPYYALLFGAFVYYIYKKTSRNHLTMWIMLIGVNLAAFHVNLSAPLFVHSLLFIMPFILAGIYNYFKLNITLLFLTLVESAYLILNFHQSYLTTLTIYDYYAMAAIFAYITIVSFVKTCLYRCTWNGMTKERSTIEHMYTSKQNFLRLFVEHSNDAIALFDLDDSILEVNPAFEKMYGWSREECVGKKLQLYPEVRRDEVRRRARMVRKGEDFQMLEVQDQKRDGTVMDVQLTLNPIFNERGDVIATSMIARDISFKLEKERLTLEAEKMKVAGEMAAGVAHEIKNPMTVISGFVQMMNEDKENPYQEYTAVLESELKRIDQIISEYLILAKPQASERSEFNLLKLLNEVMILFGPEMNNRQIAITIHSDAVNTKICAEENLMKQLFINLLKNSMEAVEQEGIIRIKIENPDEDHIGIIITDDGIGMNKDVLMKVFEPFYTTKPTGTGLGMMISKKIISNHGGSISIESEEQVGTSITIKLPVVPMMSPILV